MSDRVSTVARLRSATAADHDAVDAGFGRYDLTDTEDYRAFLIAHAKALPAVEAWLSAIPGLAAVRSRGAALAEDLALRQATEERRLLRRGGVQVVEADGGDEAGHVALCG